QQIKGLHEALYDAGFALSDQVSDDIIAEAVWHDHLMAALPARHSLLSYKHILLEEILRYPLVLGDLHACEGYSRQIERMLRKGDQEPLVAERVESVALMMALVAA
ncbi:TPA: LysR substrate-binding domain-containing protein, partial [Klebsiella pneumoniae]